MRTATAVRRVVKVVAMGLLVAAVVQEAAKPPAERTWRGRVLGVVPYDFTLPTWDRIRRAYWNPEDDRLFTDRVLGVGWAINLHRARALLSGLFARLAGADDRSVRLGPSERD
jgi:Family of unknown function (DUF5808)